jgi:hypothetical protein
MNIFFDKTCSISSVSYTTVGGVAKRGYSTLYSNIPCDFYPPSKRTMESMQYAENVKDIRYEVVLPISYNAIRENQVIELIDPVLGNRGKYLVATVIGY